MRSKWKMTHNKIRELIASWQRASAAGDLAELLDLNDQAQKGFLENLQPRA
jgi:hypothetical protein